MYNHYPQLAGLLRIFLRFVKSLSQRQSSWMQDLTQNNLAQSSTYSWNSFTKRSSWIWLAGFRIIRNNSIFSCTSRIEPVPNSTSSRRCSSRASLSVQKISAVILKTWLIRRILTTKEFWGARSRLETHRIAHTCLCSRSSKVTDCTWSCVSRTTCNNSWMYSRWELRPPHGSKTWTSTRFSRGRSMHRSTKLAKITPWLISW